MSFKDSAGLAPSLLPKEPQTPAVVMVQEILGSGTYTPLVQQGVVHHMRRVEGGTLFEATSVTRDQLKYALRTLGLSVIVT